MNIFRITSRIQQEDELAHIRLGFFPFPWMISTAAAFFQLVVLHINRKGESDLHNNNRYISFFFYNFFFSISKHPFIALVFSFRFVWHVIMFCGGETAAVEKKEPFEDASKKILLIVRKTESVHDLLKRWYLAKESEKTRRSSNGPSSEMGKKLLTDPTY